MEKVLSDYGIQLIDNIYYLCKDNEEKQIPLELENWDRLVEFIQTEDLDKFWESH